MYVHHVYVYMGDCIYRFVHELYVKCIIICKKSMYIMYRCIWATVFVDLYMIICKNVCTSWINLLKLKYVLCLVSGSSSCIRAKW